MRHFAKVTKCLRTWFESLWK